MSKKKKTKVDTSYKTPKYGRPRTKKLDTEGQPPVLIEWLKELENGK